MMHRFLKLSYLNVLSQSFRNRPRPKVLNFLDVHNFTLFKEEKFGIKQICNLHEQSITPRLKEISKTDDFLSSININALLQDATSKDNARHAVKALATLAQWHRQDNSISFENIKNNEHFPRFMSLIERKSSGLPEKMITRAIEDLIVIGVSSDHLLIETLENDLLWNIPRVPFSQLLHIFSFQINHQETERQKKVLELALGDIKRRWTDIKYPHEYHFFYNLSSHFDRNLLNQVDERLMDFLEDMELSDMSKIFVSIGNSKRRPIPLLRSLGFHMFKKTKQFKLEEIVNILYAMNTMNFVDEALLVKLCTDFISQIDELKETSIVRGVLQCMGQMRWREKSILNAVSKWMIKNIGVCRNNEIVSLLLTLASVNYQPYNFDELISLCLSRLDLSDNCDKLILIDIVWSLTILGKASSDMMSRVLSHSFIDGILINDPSRVGMCLKLLNINAVANTLMEAYTGEKLHLPFFDKLLLTKSRKDLELHEHIFKILHNFLPPPKYIKQHVSTDMGFSVDAEIIVNEKNQPLIVSDYSTAFGTVESPKPLPHGARRIALMIWSYRDYTTGDRSILGQNRLAVQLLEKRGYKVAQIPYFDVNRKDKTLKGIQYFERKFREL